jgi:hypothetical protein
MKTPSEHDAVAFLNFLRNEAEPTMDIRKERTPFDAVYSGIQNAYDTLGHHESINMPPEWCQLALDSIRSNCCFEEPEEICKWFKARGLTY